MREVDVIGIEEGSIGVGARLRISRLFVAVGLGAAACGVGLVEAAQHSDYLLMVAARNGIAPAVAPLGRLGANMRPADIDDDPLWVAAYRGHTKTVGALLDAGADIHSGDDWALRTAAEYGRTDTVKLLLSRGADVHAANDWALRRAANRGHTETVHLLLSSGADVHAANSEALRWALENGHSGTVTVLRQFASTQTPSLNPRP